MAFRPSALSPRNAVIAMRLVWFTLLCVLACAFRSNAQTVAELRLRAETIVSSDVLTLGQIAEIHAADEMNRARLASASLGYAPAVGAAREIGRVDVLRAIIAAGFRAEEVRFSGPASSLVRRAAQKLDEQLLRAAVEQAVLTELQAAGATARLVRLDLPPHVDIPTGQIEVRVAANGVRDPFTPFPLTAEVRVDGRTVRRLSLTAQVEAFAPVLVAARDLAIGRRLREEDATVEVRRLTRPVTSYLRETKQLRGMAASRLIVRGETFTIDALHAETVIRPGDQVRIEGASDRVRVAVMGEARAAGRIGDRITVRNAQSGALLQAVVVDEGVVRVRF
ncbi:MAG: flagella basal body P-ring formation protein FlgA [Pyrinomonas sp.]|uniref:flagellar basal body P-ring formation chaperone FlgA n=1 Tax=Pyrinomonas sp. TaxID=2080306 RepID=UPI00332D48C3